MPNFKSSFECLLLKIVGETPILGGVCTSKLLSFSSTCRNLKGQQPLGGQIWSYENVELNGSQCTFRTLLLVGQSSPAFFPECERNLCQYMDFPILDIFIHSGDIGDQSLELSKIVPNFSSFWPPKFFEEGLDWDVKT